MNSKVCCFTGHRNLNKSKIEVLKTRLENVIEELIKEGINEFECGGALGFDTFAALSVLKMKKIHPSVKLVLVLPCENQSLKWKNSEIQTYEYIKSNADECIYTSKEYYDGCMLRRNRYMVDHAEYVVSAWDGRKLGGTYSTVNYAKKLNRKIISLEF